MLCEKPLALTVAQAQEMLAAAEGCRCMQHGALHVQFYATTRYIRELVNQGYIGRPYHLNLRYYTGYARTNEYRWRFDQGEAGSGVLGDLGSHFLFIAMQMYGEVYSVQCQLAQFQERGPRPDGKPYDRVDDVAALSLEFSSGAQGQVYVSAMCYEDTPFGQTHHMEFHGSEGTLYSFTDWDRVQQVAGARVGEGAVRPLEIPSEYGRARGTTRYTTPIAIPFVSVTLWARGFITAIRERRPASPDFRDGLRVQRVLAAAALGAKQGRRVTLDDVD